MIIGCLSNEPSCQYRLLFSGCFGWLFQLSAAGLVTILLKHLLVNVSKDKFLPPQIFQKTLQLRNNLKSTTSILFILTFPFTFSHLPVYLTLTTKINENSSLKTYRCLSIPHRKLKVQNNEHSPNETAVSFPLL